MALLEGAGTRRITSLIMLVNRSHFIRTLLATASLAWSGMPAWAADGDQDKMDLRAILVWGTNDDAEKHPKLKSIPTSLQKRLSKVFKWKTYLEIRRKHATIRSEQECALAMSKECQVKVARVDENRVRLRLYGKGKLVVDREQSLKPGSTTVLAGDDKNDTAWFVIISRVSES